MKSTSRSCQDIFLWTSSIVGFIVDTVALIGLISSVGIANITLSGLPTAPKLGIGIFTLEWRAITLVLLIYVGIAFTTISVRREIRVFKGLDDWDEELDSRWFYTLLLLTHFFAALVLLWLMLFVPVGESWLYLNFAEAWLVGLIMIPFLRALKFAETESTRYITWELLWAGIVSFVLILPGWTLLEISLTHTPWTTAITLGVMWGVIGIFASTFLWTAALLFIALLAKFTVRFVEKLTE